jgi:hypothetical protein
MNAPATLEQERAAERRARNGNGAGWPPGHVAPMAGGDRYAMLLQDIDKATTHSQLAEIRDQAAGWELSIRGLNAEAERLAAFVRNLAERRIADADIRKPLGGMPLTAA